MKALVKVNRKSIGWFYSKNETETRTEVYQRIMDVITYRFGVCESIIIDWEY